MNLTISIGQVVALSESQHSGSTITSLEQAVERAEQNAKLSPEELALLQHESSEAVNENEEFQERLSDWQSARFCR
jgi:hypothetical protein